MKKTLRVLAMAGAMIAAHTAGAAQARGLGAEISGVKAEGQWGGDLGLGYGFEVGPFSLRPIVGAFVFKGNNDRYYVDTFNNGQQRCRDHRNGQFAADRFCNNVAAEFYGKVEATFSIPTVAEIGVGARYMDETVRPYGLIAVPIAPKFKAVASGGKEFISAGIRFGF